MLKSSDRIAHDIEILQQLQQPQQPCNTSAAPLAQQPIDAHLPAAQGSDLSPSPPVLPNDSQSPLVATLEASETGPSPTLPDSQPTPSASAAIPALPRCSAVLVLRKWADLRPEREFRCFVRAGNLVGVCQRDVSQHFPQLTSEASRGTSDHSPSDGRQQQEGGPLSTVKGAIAGFHLDHMLGSAPGGLRDCEYGVFKLQGDWKCEGSHNCFIFLIVHMPFSTLIAPPVQSAMTSMCPPHCL